MKRMHWALWLVLAAFLLNAGAIVWSTRNTPRLAYVRSQDLVYGYFGMKEAMADFQEKQSGWRSNLDTLKNDLQRTMAEAQRLHKAGNTAALNDLQPVIRKQHDEIGRYQEVMEQKSKEDEQRILNGVLGQINAFVETYAKEKGYDVVLGTTDAGSLLYGEGGLDITNELLAALNKEHEGLAP